MDRSSAVRKFPNVTKIATVRNKTIHTIYNLYIFYSICIYFTTKCYGFPNKQFSQLKKTDNFTVG